MFFRPSLRYPANAGAFVKHDEKVLFRVHLPLWFWWFLAICACGLLAIISMVGIRLVQIADWSESKPWKGLFVLIFLILLVCMSRDAFSTILVSSGGLEVQRIWWVKRKVLWDDIVRVSLPPFGIPIDYIRIHLKDGKIVILGKSMKGRRKLLQLIDAKARHVKIDEEVLPFME
jgi:hypothetical protein